MEALEHADSLRTPDPLNAEWVTLVLLVVLAALAYTNINSPRKWRLLAQGMFRMRLGRQTLREEIDLQDRTFIGLLIVAIAGLSLFLWQASVLLDPVGHPHFHWFVIGITAVLLLQGILLRSIATISDSDQGITEFLSTGLLLFILTGVALLPIAALVAYRSHWRPLLLTVGVGLVVILLLYRWLRGAWVGASEGVPLRYIIIYLCAAEIVPILLLIHTWRYMLPASSQP
jgi:hypothetical protein